MQIHRKIVRRQSESAFFLQFQNNIENKRVFGVKTTGGPTVGFSYGFFILYYSLGLLAAINISLGIANIWNISQFLSQIFITAALLGLVFEFPLLLTLFIKLGITTPQTLKNKRRIAYFCIFCITALLPPTDVLSLVAMVLPLVLLYEATILLNNGKNYVWIRSS